MEETVSWRAWGWSESDAVTFVSAAATTVSTMWYAQSACVSSSSSLASRILESPQ
jgi:hypothetical protein